MVKTLPVIQEEELTRIYIFSDGPDECKDGTVRLHFKTPTSETCIVDIGRFDDGMRMYQLYERFAERGWQWGHNFMEMDAFQLADYLTGYANLPDDTGWEDHDAYCEGLRRCVKKLRTRDYI